MFRSNLILARVLRGSCILHGAFPAIELPRVVFSRSATLALGG